MNDLPARRGEQRASDTDRDIVAGDLRDAFGSGRLDADEYERRLQAVWESRTYGELDRLTADLPEPVERHQREAEHQEKKAVAERKKHELHEYLGEWQAWLVGAVIMIGIWAVTSFADGGGPEKFWPGIPLGIWAVILIASAFGGDKK